MGLLLILMAPLAFALVNIIDDHLVKKVDEGGAGSLTLFSGFFGFVVAIGILFISLFLGENIFIDRESILVLLLAGGFELIWLPFYFKSLEEDEASSVIPLFQLTPIFVYILAIIFLGEKITTNFLLFSSLIVIGAFILQTNFQGKVRFKINSALYMVIASFFVAMGAVLFKFVAIDEVSFWVSLFWLNMGYGLAAVILAVSKRSYFKEFKRLVNVSGLSVLRFNITNEVLNAIGNMIISYTSLLVPISLVFAINSLQPLYLLVIGFICVKFFPNFSGETIKGKGYYFKILAIGIMITGSILLGYELEKTGVLDLLN